MEHLVFKDTTAQVLRGPFPASEANIDVYEDKVSLDISVEAPTSLKRVSFHLTPEDADALGRGLLKVSSSSAGFRDIQQAMDMLVAFLRSLSASSWLSQDDLKSIQIEAQNLKELLELSVPPETDNHGS